MQSKSLYLSLNKCFQTCSQFEGHHSRTRVLILFLLTASLVIKRKRRRKSGTWNKWCLSWDPLEVTARKLSLQLVTFCWIVPHSQSIFRRRRWNSCISLFFRFLVRKDSFTEQLEHLRMHIAVWAWLFARCVTRASSNVFWQGWRQVACELDLPASTCVLCLAAEGRFLPSFLKSCSFESFHYKTSSWRDEKTFWPVEPCGMVQDFQEICPPPSMSIPPPLPPKKRIC